MHQKYPVQRSLHSTFFFFIYIYYDDTYADVILHFDEEINYYYCYMVILLRSKFFITITKLFINDIYREILEDL